MMPTIGDRRREMQRTIDALRAKLDSASEHAFREEEACRVALRDMEQACDQRDSIAFALAAEQADNARLREAALRYIKAWNDANVPGEEGDAALVELGRLANSPSSDAALREVCAQMGTEAVTAYIGGASEKAAVDKALEGVLGPEVAR